MGQNGSRETHPNLAFVATPICFHKDTHSSNIRISTSGRKAKRIESFCKGICFSDRPVRVEERICFELSEVSAGWSGVLRFGFTSINPQNIQPSSLPRYACPDLTNKRGYWAKALGERLANRQGVRVCTYFTSSGDVFYSVSNRVGEFNNFQLFLSGMSTGTHLWLMMDIYGNTTAVTFFDLAPPKAGHSGASPVPILHPVPETQPAFTSNNAVKGPMRDVPLPPVPVVSAASEACGNAPIALPRRLSAGASSIPSLANQTGAPKKPALAPDNVCLHLSWSRCDMDISCVFPADDAMFALSNLCVAQDNHWIVLWNISIALDLPLKYNQRVQVAPIALCAGAKGKNVTISGSARNIAYRHSEEYCNAYVFLSEPLTCGRKLIVQVLGVDQSYIGGMAFGLTSCNPSELNNESFPDDSDLLLDRPEYWLVNKDVSQSTRVGDELTFTMTTDGKLIYGKNGYDLASTLMHVDVTVAMYPFIDLYGLVVKLRIVGYASASAPSNGDSSSSRPPLQSSIPSLSPVTALDRNSPSPATTTQLHAHAQQPLQHTQQPAHRSVSSLLDTPLAASLIPPPPNLRPKVASASTDQMNAPVLLAPSISAADRSKSTVSASHFAAQRTDFSSEDDPFVVNLDDIMSTRASQSIVGGGRASGAADLFADFSLSRNLAPGGDGSTPSMMNAVNERNELAAVAAADATDLGLTTFPDDRPSTAASGGSNDGTNECVVCFERAVDCVIYKCGHLCMCYSCALDVKRTPGAKCPICRSQIDDVIRLYRS